MVARVEGIAQVKIFFIRLIFFFIIYLKQIFLIIGLVQNYYYI